MAMMRLGVFGHRVMPIAFGMALVVFLWLRDRRLLWVSSAIFAATTVFKYMRGPIVAAGAEAPFGERIFDLALILFDLLVMTAVVHLLIGARDKLERRNAELTAGNDELAAREEEISRQNEELQSQTEELERQSEELRVTNDELATRERMLETLLDLSRSLHLGLSEDEAVDRICETMGQLVNGPGTAAAILLSENAFAGGDGSDGHLRVRCHHGFGPTGIQRDVIPAARSFASLVIEQRRTGYLEDVALRPELEIPQPSAGSAPAMVSVLATPLTVRGKPIGTLEVYCTQRKAWSDDQIALVESLAAQTAVTLEN
jgi:hypothetical protein